MKNKYLNYFSYISNSNKIEIQGVSNVSAKKIVGNLGKIHRKLNLK